VGAQEGRIFASQTKLPKEQRRHMNQQLRALADIEPKIRTISERVATAERELAALGSPETLFEGNYVNDGATLTNREAISTSLNVSS
jgi:uncharacterized membrane protein